MNKCVCIAGAFGFIGRYTAKEFKKNGYTVIGIGHGHWDKDEYKAWGVDHWYHCEITVENLCMIAQRPELVIQCAGSGSVAESAANPVLAFLRTVHSTHHILEYIKEFSSKTKLIYLSSAAVYGEVDKLPIKEDGELKPISIYGLHKKIAEDLCFFYRDQYGLSILVTRLFSVYGEGLRKQLLWDACNKIKNGNRYFWGTGEEKRDWIHVSDVAKLFFCANDKVGSFPHVINVGSGEAVSVKTILYMIYQLHKKEKCPIFENKKSVGNPRNYQADIKRISSWGWKPEILLQDGVNQYVEWCRRYG